jgi:hypothetical protein
MPYNANAGIAVATQSASSTFYYLTDHNRQPITFDFETIERSARMADGTMRKFVVAKKMKISTGWNDLPSGTGVPVSDYDVIQLTPSTVADVWTNSTGNTNTATPGQTYTATANIRRTSSSTASAYIRLDWYSASNTLISTSPGTPVSINNNSWSQISASAVAPATTAYAITTINATPASITDYIYVKSVNFAGNSVATSRFVAGTNTTISLTYLSNLNSGYTMTVDGYKGGAWIKDFYETNLFKPVYVKITHSQDAASANAANAFYPSPSASGYEVIQAFMTSLTYEVTKRYTLTDLVNVRIEFTEI